jgi:feruloyl esterase
MKDPRAYISSLKLPAIQKKALADCDALDGVTDGIISDPTQCHFVPAEMLCKGADTLDCLTQQQVASLEKLYEGGADSRGKSIFPGYSMGDEVGAWHGWVVGSAPGSGLGSQFVKNYFRYMVTGDPTWNMLTANVDASLKEAIKTTAADLDATNPDLTPFVARGGKLIIYHGWNDPAISPWGSIDYYESVEKRMGPEKVNSFMRLYLVPGMEHCVGGPGPDSFGQLGLPTVKRPKYGVFDALVGWVEDGIPSETIVATKYGPRSSSENKATMTRPICPYPQVPIYKGSGDTNDAANFACAKK